MDESVCILGIPGSLAAQSPANRLLHCAGDLAERIEAPIGPVEVEVLDPEVLRELPHFEPDEDVRAEVRPLLIAAADADAVLISTCEHNCSYPGALKDAVDWLSAGASPPLDDVPAAAIGISEDRFGADWAQADLRKVLDASGARTLLAELAIPEAGGAFSQRDGRTELTDEALSARLELLLIELGELARHRVAG